MHAAIAAESHQRQISRIAPTFDGHSPDSARHGRIRYRTNTVRGVFQGNPQRFTDELTDRSFGKFSFDVQLAAGKPVCLHMYGGPVGLYASAHLMAALAGTMWLEMEATPNPIFAKLLGAPPAVDGGALHLTDAPGLGVAFDVGVIRAGDVTEP